MDWNKYSHLDEWNEANKIWENARLMKENMPKTTLTLEDGYGTYTISVNKQDMSIDEVVEELVEKVLLAAGYHINSINEVLGRNE